ncbi:MAG: GyrI-like domain-containing protein [Epsilonproteobacteria bacterium]|nr:GyrI-like domain-containing protein [Campylobacterota bacterium]
MIPRLDRSVDRAKLKRVDRVALEVHAQRRLICATHYGSCDESLSSRLGLYSWCEQNGHKFRDIPPFEKYVNMIEEMDNPKAQITEIYIPIE